MKEKMKKIITLLDKYNSPQMARDIFGFPEDDIVYDALVVAPSFTPEKILTEINTKTDGRFKITTNRIGTYTAGYTVEGDGVKLLWIQVASCAGNTVDHVGILGKMKFRRMIFIGAVGSLKPEFELGDLCIPTECVSGGYILSYLKDDLSDFTPFERVYPDKTTTDRSVILANQRIDEFVRDNIIPRGISLKRASVFCTDSIVMEYYHLDEIRAFGTDLIEMETAAFYSMADLLEVPSAAILLVSDNSATGVALVGRTDEQEEKYNYARRVVLPEILFKLAGEL